MSGEGICLRGVTHTPSHPGSTCRPRLACSRRRSCSGNPASLTGMLTVARVQVNEEATPGTAEIAALDVVAKVWKCSSLRANLTISRFVSVGLLRVQDVLDWVFLPSPESSAPAPKLVDTEEGTATTALECVLSLLTALLEQAQVWQRHAELKGMRNQVTSCVCKRHTVCCVRVPAMLCTRWRCPPGSCHTPATARRSTRRHMLGCT